MGIFVGAAAVGVLSAFMSVPEFSLILCMMIGLGVGIDYALFIVTRHRQLLHDGMSVEDSAGTAIATAGQAVLFAGTTVVIAILGLCLAGLPAISSMGVSVALVVAVAMAIAITLALLGALLGTGGAYLALVAWHRSDLHPLTRVPSLDLVIIIVGLPLLAIAAGWLLAGREPASITHQPLE